eukprot:5507371-Prymnesium_polylepis.1
MLEISGEFARFRGPMQRWAYREAKRPIPEPAGGRAPSAQKDGVLLGDGRSPGGSIPRDTQQGTSPTIDSSGRTRRRSRSRRTIELQEPGVGSRRRRTGSHRLAARPARSRWQPATAVGGLT